MMMRHRVSIVRLGSAFALALALTGCTKGGQFDPTVLLDNDMFDSKTPLKGQREPVFPSGVPGVATGIPADLYKGYQPPPEQAADIGGAPTPINPAAGEPQERAAESQPKTKPKAKARPKLARARAKRPRTVIDVGLRSRPKAAAQQPAQRSQSIWPAPPPTSSAQQAAQPSQSIWPAPPPTGSAQPSQSIWPNPPAPPASGTASQ